MALTGLKAATLLAGLAGAIAAPGVAQAQFYFDAWGGRFDAPLAGDDEYDRGYERRDFRDQDRPGQFISRREVAAMLSRRGYRVNPSIARNNDVYLVEAVDPSGQRLRIVVDAFDGAILRRTVAGAPGGALSRRDDADRWPEDDGFGQPPRGDAPRVIPGVGPTQRKPAPKKPTTARIEPRATTVPKPEATQPAPAPAAPPATAPAPATPGPAAAAEPRTPAPDVQAKAPAAAEPAHPAAPRVIPLYKTPAESAAEKPPEGPP